MIVVITLIITMILFGIAFYYIGKRIENALKSMDDCK